MTTNIISLFKGVILLILSYIGIIITYSEGLNIHIREGSPGWFLIIGICFILTVKGIHTIYTFIRRRLRCFHLNLLRQKRKNQRNATKQNNHRN